LIIVKDYFIKLCDQSQEKQSAIDSFLKNRLKKECPNDYNKYGLLSISTEVDVFWRQSAQSLCARERENE
jgi:hypothetical protein